MTSNAPRPETPPIEIRATAADREALRRLRRDAGSWLTVDWRALQELQPPGALDRRPVARDSWAPFTL